MPNIAPTAAAAVVRKVVLSMYLVTRPPLARSALNFTHLMRKRMH